MVVKKKYTRTEETKKKISLANKGKTFPKKKYPNYGMRQKHCSNEHKRKIGLGNKGKIRSKKMKEDLRKINKGKHASEKTKMKMSISAKNSINKGRFKKGRKLSEETRMKMVGKKKSEETKRKMKDTWNKPKYKKIAKERRKKLIFPTKDTSIEIKIQDFLKQLKIEFFTHQYMKIKHGYQCDILVPSKNLVIECDGDYWHKYPIGLKKDHLRTKELIEKGFKVLRLWENEIRKITLKQFEAKLND